MGSLNSLNKESAREIVKDGTWFRDSKGRYVLFRGINFASRSKLPPYIPVAPLHTSSIDLDELRKELTAVKTKLEYLKVLGLNIIRLLVMWKAIEPRPNPNLNQLLPEGERYLFLIKEVMDVLYEHDLFVILDFHQDIAHEVYGGDGFPDWALAIDEFHPRPAQSNLENRRWAASYYFNNLVQFTLRSFWKNNLKNIEAGLVDFRVRTHLEKTIGQTVKYFKDTNNGAGHAALLGIEPFNEPHQGDIGKRDFERSFLKDFYGNVISEINKFDNKLFVFIEPRVGWNLYSAFNIFEPSKDWREDSLQRTIESHLRFINSAIQVLTWLPTGKDFLDQFKSQGVFSFHYYDFWTLFRSFLNLPDNMHKKQKEWPDIFNQMRKAGIRRGLIPFITEFGGSHDWEEFHTDLKPEASYQGKQIRAYMNLQFVQVESLLLNAIYWNYDLYNNKEKKDNWNLENFSLLGPNRKPRHPDLIARPYPMRSSARPHLLFFDLDTKHCAIILKGPVVDEPTIIFIPVVFHYSHNFKVLASSNAVIWDKEKQLLYWYPDKNQAANQIIISPHKDLNSSVLPNESKQMLNKTNHAFDITN